MPVQMRGSRDDPPTPRIYLLTFKSMHAAFVQSGGTYQFDNGGNVCFGFSSSRLRQDISLLACRWSFTLTAKTPFIFSMSTAIC